LELDNYFREGIINVFLRWLMMTDMRGLFSGKMTRKKNFKIKRMECGVVG